MLKKIKVLLDNGDIAEVLKGVKTVMRPEPPNGWITYKVVKEIKE